jgi:hypothetical protein
MDIRAEARRLASIATVFVWVGWFFVFYAIVSGIFWWIDLAQSALDLAKQGHDPFYGKGWVNALAACRQ